MRSPSEESEDRRVSISKAGEILGVTPDTIRKLIRTGELPAYMIGRNSHRQTIRVKLSDVQACAHLVPTVGTLELAANLGGE